MPDIIMEVGIYLWRKLVRTTKIITYYSYMQRQIYHKIRLYTYVGYLGAGIDYFSKGFVHTPDQNEIKADQDRTRRALSNAPFTFSLALLQTGEKPQILQKNDAKIIYFLKYRARFAHRPDQNL